MLKSSIYRDRQNDSAAELKKLLIILGLVWKSGDFNAIIKRSRPKITLFPPAAGMRRANERNERTFKGVLRSPV